LLDRRPRASYPRAAQLEVGGAAGAARRLIGEATVRSRHVARLDEAREVVALSERVLGTLDEVLDVAL
jgi:hypothetical protein